MVASTAVFFSALHPASYIWVPPSREDGQERKKKAHEVKEGLQLSKTEERAVEEGRLAALEVFIRISRSWRSRPIENTPHIAPDEPRGPSRPSWSTTRRPNWVPDEWSVVWDSLVQFAAAVVGSHFLSAERKVEFQMSQQNLINRLVYDFQTMLGVRAGVYLKGVLTEVPKRLKSDPNDTDLSLFYLKTATLVRMTEVEDPDCIPDWPVLNEVKRNVVMDRVNQLQLVRLISFVVLPQDLTHALNFTA